MSGVSTRLATIRELAKPGVYTHASRDGALSFSNRYLKQDVISSSLRQKIILIAEGISRPFANEIAERLETSQPLSQAQINTLAAAEGNTPFGKIMLDSGDLETLRMRHERTEDAEYDRWFNDAYINSDPKAKQFANKINPAYFQTRLDDFRAKLDMIFRMKRLQLVGPKNEDDLVLEWALREGKITLPPGWDRVGIPAPERLTRGEILTTIRRGDLDTTGVFRYRRRPRPVAQWFDNNGVMRDNLFGNGQYAARQTRLTNAAQGQASVASAKLLGNSMFSIRGG